MLQKLHPSSMMFFLMLLLSTFLSISSNNLILIWAGMEMNLMAFIPLMLMKKATYELESAVKYFIVQAPTTIILMTMIVAFEYNIKMGIISPMLIMVMVLLIKLGSAPFHMWFPQVISKLNWLSVMLILTWQKVAPMFILSLIHPTQFLMFTILSIMNNIVGALGGISQSQMRNLLAYSSFSHFSWMLAAYMISWDLMMIYFIFYSLMNLFVLLPLSNMSNKSALNFKKMNQIHKENQVTFWVDMMSMAGLPPLLGFLPKWLVIVYVISFSPILVLSLMLGSLISLFYYLRVVVIMMMTNDLSMFTQNKMKWTHMLAWSRLPIFFYYFMVGDFFIMII